MKRGPLDRSSAEFDIRDTLFVMAEPRSAKELRTALRPLRLSIMSAERMMHRAGWEDLQ